MNLTKDMDAALMRFLKVCDEEGVEYSIGEPGTGKILVVDGDKVLGELKPYDENQAREAAEHFVGLYFGDRLTSIQKELSNQFKIDEYSDKK